MSAASTAARVIRQLIYGPSPIAVADAQALAQATARQLSGIAGGPAPVFGMPGTPALTWSGWTASPQQFIGSLQMGKARTAVVQEYPALPNATAPPGTSSWLAEMERMDNQGLL